MAKSLLHVAPLLLLLAAAAAVAEDHPIGENLNRSATAYDELKTNGFPIGLLPTTVLSYTLNSTTGDFAVELDGSGCRLTLPPDNYLASYSGRITGRLRDHRIAELDGIRVRAFFRWWSITGIRSDGDNLVFEVGAVSAKYPSRNFDEIPVCQGRKASS